MNITALTSSSQQTRIIERPHPLISVISWELRRFYASRLFWLQALGFFCFLLFLTWATQSPEQFGTMHNGVGVSGFVAGTSAWGLLLTLPSSLVLLVLLLPFITADGVTRDLNRHTHELLMTTALPSWAYVWGRYLVGLLISLGLALLMLAAILSMGLLLHLTVQDYPLPQTGALLLLWVGMVLPATILVSSLGFALGTLLPPLSTLVKVTILVGWIMGAMVIPTGFANAVPPAWYVTWDPTSAITARGLVSPYSFSDAASKITSQDQFQQIFLAIENKMPTIGDWFAAHLFLAVASLVLVLIAALAFKRSRDVLN